MIAIIPNCSILAAVGQKMASTPGVSATLFDALAKANLNIRAQGCSEYNITVVVKREDCVKALRAVHSRFYLSRIAITMGIIGPGLIGGTLPDQLRDQAAVLKENFNIGLRVMGITGSNTMLLSDTLSRSDFSCGRCPSSRSDKTRGRSSCCAVDLMPLTNMHLHPISH